MHKSIKELENYLVLSNYSSATRKSYVSAVTNFYKWCVQHQHDPDFDKANAHRAYLVARSKSGVAWQTVNGDYSGIRMLYTKVLGREWDVEKVPRPRRETFLPTVLSQDQIKELIEHATMFKHQFFMLLLYGTGLRLSEALNLKLENINVERLQLHVKKGKGHKDRMVILPKSFIKLLEAYVDYYHPKEYLFNGKYRASRWSNRAAQECINMAIQKGNLSRLISAHTLRHSYATHHIEKGTDLFTLQKQLGHKHLKTTARYVHLCTKHIQQIKHPINDLCLGLKHNNSENCLGNMENPS